MAKGAVPFSRFCEKGTVPFAATEKGTAPVSKRPETGAAPFSPPRYPIQPALGRRLGAAPVQENSLRNRNCFNLRVRRLPIQTCESDS